MPAILGRKDLRRNFSAALAVEQVPDQRQLLRREVLKKCSELRRGKVVLGRERRLRQAEQKTAAAQGEEDVTLDARTISWGRGRSIEVEEP